MTALMQLQPACAADSEFFASSPDEGDSNSGSMAADYSHISSTLGPAANALFEGKPHDAVRAIMAAMIARKIPLGRVLPKWLSQNAGSDFTRGLIGAFAEYPCFVCRGGYEACDNCAEKGRIGNTLCETCLGFGICNCKFCGGSGLVAIDFVPQGLRILVSLRRVHTACRQINQLLLQMRATRNAVRRNGPCASRKALAAMILRWNRLLTVFENVILALQLSCDHEPMDAKSRDMWIERCVRLGSRADRQIRRLLRKLAQESSPTAANFYAQLVEDSAFRSELDHPFFRRARSTIKAPKAGSNPSGSNGQVHSLRSSIVPSKTPGVKARKQGDLP